MNNIVLYDGDCGFCNFWVQWILKNDKQHKFMFASLQGNFGQEFLIKNNFPTKIFDTVYFLKDNRSYSKLDAVAEIGKALGGIYRILAVAKILPSFIADPIYDLIAKNRKKIAGESCMLITPQEKLQFIN